MEACFSFSLFLSACSSFSHSPVALLYLSVENRWMSLSLAPSASLRTAVLGSASASLLLSFTGRPFSALQLLSALSSQLILPPSINRQHHSLLGCISGVSSFVHRSGSCLLRPQLYKTTGCRRLVHSLSPPSLTHQPSHLHFHHFIASQTVLPHFHSQLQQCRQTRLLHHGIHRRHFHRSPAPRVFNPVKNTNLPHRPATFPPSFNMAMNGNSKRRLSETTPPHPSLKRVNSDIPPAMMDSSGDQTPAEFPTYPFDPEAAAAAAAHMLPAISQAQTDSAEWQETIQNVVTTVVSIHFCQTASFDTDLSMASQATGFVVDAKRGYILTNRHVVCAGPFWGYCVFDNHEEVCWY